MAALEQWPASGVPANPGAWLTAIAKRRGIDRFRREELGERKRDEFGRVHRRPDEPAGEPVLLLDQDRSRWNQLLIRRGFAVLDRSERLGGALGPYALQAAIAACHARARIAQDTDWVRIAALYDALLEVMPSPIVALNRAVAVGFGYGPAAGLEAVEELRFEKSLEVTICLRACAVIYSRAWGAAPRLHSIFGAPQRPRRTHANARSCSIAQLLPAMSISRLAVRRNRFKGDIRYEHSVERDPPGIGTAYTEPGRNRMDRCPYFGVGQRRFARRRGWNVARLARDADHAASR